MGLYDVGSVTTTNLNSELTKTSIDSANTEVDLYTPEWTKYNGIYQENGIVRAIIDKFAKLTIGKKIKAKEKSRQEQLDKITGNGKDTIINICQNIERTADICGDSLGEIVKNDRGALLNLKQLNPQMMQIESNKLGIIQHYNQLSTHNPKEKIGNGWVPNRIFHLCRNRIADSIGGIPMIKAIETDVLMMKEAERVMQKIVKRNSKPIVIIEADTQNDEEMTTLKTQYKNLLENDEAMIVPKGSINMVDFKSTMSIDPLPWMNYLIKKILMSSGMPLLFLGVSGLDTEGESKMIYLALENFIKERRANFLEQWRMQIGFEIECEEMISIDPMILTDMRKGGGNDMPNQKGDVNPNKKEK